MCFEIPAPLNRTSKNAHIFFLDMFGAFIL